MYTLTRGRAGREHTQPRNEIGMRLSSIMHNQFVLPIQCQVIQYLMSVDSNRRPRSLSVDTSATGAGVDCETGAAVALEPFQSGTVEPSAVLWVGTISHECCIREAGVGVVGNHVQIAECLWLSGLDLGFEVVEDCALIQYSPQTQGTLRQTCPDLQN